MSSFNKSSETLKPKSPFVVLKPYVAVLASLLIVLGVIAAAHAVSRQIPISLLLLIPVSIGAFLGGFGAGIFAIILGLAADHFLFGESAFHIRRLFPYVNEQARFVFFIIEGLLLTGIGHWHRLSKLRAHESVRRQQMLEQEIVDRRELEESVARSQRALQSQLAEIEGIYAAAPVGLCFLDRDLRFVRINQRLAEIHGIPVEAHVGRTVQEAIPEIGLAIIPQLRRVIASGEPILEKEISGVMPDDSRAERVLLASFFPVKQSDGFVSGVNVAVQEITEQKRFEVVLRESEEKYRLLAEVSPLVIWTAAPDGTLTYASQHWLDYSGLTLKDTQGQGWASVLHPEDRERVFAEQPEILRKKCPYETELRFRCKQTGEYRWHLIRALPLHDELGKISQWVGIAMDIHQIKCGEKALRVSEARLLLALEAGRMAAWERDSSTGGVAWLDPMHIRSAIDFEDQFQTWVQGIADRDLPSFPEAKDQPIQSYSQEFRIVLPDGRLNWLEVQGQPILDNQGRCRRLIGILSDITERKHGEESLRHTERLYRTIGESMKYGMWVSTPEGSLTYASESFLTLTGLSVDQCSGFGWMAAVHPDDAHRVWGSWKQAVRTLQPWDSEYRCRGTDGCWHPILARGLPVKDSRGAVICWAGINLDISRLKEAEEALREADRKKDEFIALLAHELRNPLAPILTSAQLLKRRGSERPELLESASSSIERQVKYLTRLINDLVDVSRAARGKLKLSFEVADMASAISQAIEGCQPVIEKNQQELVLRGVDQQLYIWGDPARLSQIVGNLLMNASKFTPIKGRIELEMNRVGKEISITVRDNGIGIEPNALEHIFEPFVQFERPLHSGHSGLGVGLALAKSLVEMHGGKISVASPGKDHGSEFSIRLPLFDQLSGRKSDPAAGEDEVQPIRSPIPCDKAHPARALKG